MNRNTLTTAVIAGIAGVAGIANMASAVNLNPDGLGQVLLYPYYTVNIHQQTLLSVVNTTSVGKAVKVRFLEGYNSREVLDFNLFLSPFDVWTAAVFALADGVPVVSGSAGPPGAGIFSLDNTCTAPQFATTGLVNGAKYQPFLDFLFTGAYTDSGPSTDDRTQEGHFEMISMGDIVAGSALAKDITHVNSVPPKCASAETDFETGGTFASIVAPTSGLFGAAAVVDVSQGTFYSYNADAIDGFTSTQLGNNTGSLFPSLAQVNDAGAPTTVTSFVFTDGTLATSVYDQATAAIDAVSSIFAAANLYNQYESAADGSVGSDWVVNFPTKRFYVDPLYVSTTVIAPFEEVFGGLRCSATTGSCAYTDPGNSCVTVGINIFDREENTTSQTTCGFSPCPPGQAPSSVCKETNIISFLADGTKPDILGSNLRTNIAPLGTNGWLNLDLNTAGAPHAMRASTNGNVFNGLPVTGFEAVDFLNGNLNGVLSNYSGVFRHRNSRNCTNAAGVCS